jgi:GR25 family glycosyltransferase involved in LPS biosynthesis
MDKNKSVYKLKNLPPIYYINLDDQTERNRYMEEQFNYWEINRHTRISAYDGRDSDLSEILKGTYPENMTSGEIGCTCSHLKAIKYWYETSDSPYALFMEDDIDISIARFWNFTFSDFIARAPYAWDCIQLAIISTGDINVSIHTRFINSFSTACYILTRRYAKKLIDLHVRGENLYRLDNGVKPRATADDLIYNAGVTYACPLFLYKIELGSSIHPEHLEAFHKNSYDGIYNFWSQAGARLTLEQITDYNPYLGRISVPSGQVAQETPLSP